MRINGVRVNPQTVVVSTARDGTFNGVDFSVGLFIVGDADATFSLSSWGPGFSSPMWVTASIAGAPPQVIPRGLEPTQ